MTTNEEDQLYEEIRKMISELTGIDENKIKGDASFRRDLGMRSNLALQLLLIFDNKYNIQITEDRYPELNTLNSVVALVRESIEAQKKS